MKDFSSPRTPAGWGAQTPTFPNFPPDSSMIDIVTGLPIDPSTLRHRVEFERDYSAVFGDNGRGRYEHRATDATKPPDRPGRQDSRNGRGRRSPPPTGRSSPPRRGSRRRSRSRPDKNGGRHSRPRAERRRSRSRLNRTNGRSRERRSRTRQRATKNYSSNRSDISLSRELRKDLVNKHAFGSFSVADFDATARTFWDNGYQNVSSIRDMDARERFPPQTNPIGH